MYVSIYEFTEHNVCLPVGFSLNARKAAVPHKILMFPPNYESQWQNDE